MFCPNCGNEMNAESFTFCSKCGTKLTPPPGGAAGTGAQGPTSYGGAFTPPASYGTPPPQQQPPQQPQAGSYQQQPPQGQYAPPPGGYPPPAYGAQQQQGYPYAQNQYAPAGAVPGGAFSAGECIGNGWELVKANIGIFILGTLIYFVISGALGFLPGGMKRLGSLVQFVVGGPLLGGMFVMAFKAMNGQSPEIGDVFKGFSRFLPLFLANLVMTIFIGIGFCLLVIPGIYLAVSYSFTIPLIIDQNMDFWTAMETSRKTVGQCWFSIFGLALLCLVVTLLGAIALGVGLLVTTPICLCAMAYAYTKLFPRMNALP